jgi:hypothetical protein
MGLIFILIAYLIACICIAYKTQKKYYNGAYTFIVLMISIFGTPFIGYLLYKF